jgi:Ca2+-binding EF-hand superfamily protein
MTDKARSLRLPVAAALLVLAAAGAALAVARADSGRGFGTRMFMKHEGPLEKADANADGAVDQAEWNALFAKLDADGNGKLQGAELPGPHGFPPPEALAFMLAHEADADLDGKVTTAEWQARIAALDTDKDGALAANELQFRHRSEEAADGLPRFVTQWDTNGDGRLDTAELDALFAAVDDDKDGVLTFPHERHHFHG